MEKSITMLTDNETYPKMGTMRRWTGENTYYAPTKIDPHETEGRGIPFHIVNKLLERLPYASTMSVGIKLLIFTGSRIQELENMKRCMLQENYIYWKCGKNQNGWRKEYLPNDFIKEMQEYWNNERIEQNNMINVKPNTFRRYFTRLRKRLSPEWREKRKIMIGNEIKTQYSYALKGFRKNFATLLFTYFWDKYGDSGVAVERVSKRMKHSSRHMTANHYIETMEQIDGPRFKGFLPFEIVTQIKQKRLVDYI